MLDRTIAPEFHPTISINLPSIVKNSQINGIGIYSISNSNLDVFRMEVVFKAGSYFGEQFGQSFFVSKLLPLGTQSKTAKEIAETFERFGGFLEAGQNQERLIITLHGLTQHFGEYLDILKELIFEPLLPENELEIQKNVASQSYLVSVEKTAFEANKFFREHLFGKTHSFGKTLGPDEIEKIDRNSLASFHNDFIKEEDFNIFLSGNISSKEIEMVQNIFNKNVEKVAARAIISPISQPQFYLNIEKENSVQSSIRIGRRMFNRHHEDFVKFLVFNTIFGGFFGSRLMKNIREEKGLTYGISSSLVPLAAEGYWSIGADVKKENVGLAMDEIQKEIDVLKNVFVSQDELDLVKNYMKGSVLSSTNTVFDIMDKHKAIMHESLPLDFYDTLLCRIDMVTAMDISEMANKYMADLNSVVAG
ncbi:insulinase family protein [Lacihabitans sp. LS3-19]|uniref:M16 family metallopeptidase n=1 Tax=Lacihabitans sp. LS3-19 TaxID=2487335 RepID=UPI0020CE05C5|nr:pitrilysin family protein [Lacihabitans sp. LS3-19]MCP9767741.1 insulinase family protein [Lacihabitans sp. LS3-19]